MTNEELNALAPGLYRIFWERGGKSLAAIGMKSDGKRWIAPTNWLEPSDVGKTNWSAIERVERIDPDTVSAPAEPVVNEAMQDMATFGTGALYQSSDGKVSAVDPRDYIGTGQEEAIFNDVVKPDAKADRPGSIFPDYAGDFVNVVDISGRIFVVCEAAIFDLRGMELHPLRFVSQ